MLHPRLTKTIARLRGKITRTAILRGICFGLGAVALVGIVAVGLDRIVVVPRLPPVVLGALVALVLVAACALSLRRARRSDVELAQALDVQNQLDDRLASAIEFAQAPGEPWKERAIADAVAVVERTALRLPRVPVGHVERPLLVVLLFAGLVGALQLARRPLRELDAKARVQLAASTAAAEKARVEGLAAQASALADPQAGEVARALDAAIAAGSRGDQRKEELLARLADIRRQLAAGAPQTTAGPGVGSGGDGLPPDSLVRGVASDLKSGDLRAAGASLARAAEALGRGELSGDEARVLGELSRHLEQLAARGQSPLEPTLAEASAALGRGDLADASRALADAAPKLGELSSSVKREQLYDDLEASLRRVEQGARSSVVDTPGAPLPPPGQDTVAAQNDTQAQAPLGRSDKHVDPNAQGGQVAYQGTTGKGSFSVGRDQRQAASDPGTSTKDLAVVGQWSGKTIRELLSGSSLSSAAPALADVVGAHERVAETRLDREDVPEDYRLAVRNYFEAIRVAGEGAWK